ncbi:MAG: DUF2752 domain-containing protein [Burkholderiales bacterium]|nr:DUF2752 domain-containing protein [Phycisphaerae bacterium]
MSELAPPIYVRLGGPPRLGWLSRLLALAIALGALCVLLTAARLIPEAGGIGTHTQLGLAPCAFLDRTGIPCAGCGMTTSFAHFVRGQVFASFFAQPFGFVLAVCTAVVFWGAIYVGTTGKASYRLLLMIPLKAHLFFWLGFAALGWIWKLIAVVSSH